MIHQSLGFTLLELLIVLMISSILFVLCQIDLSPFFTAVNNEADAHRFFQTLAFARGQAIKGNRLIFVCPTQNQKECSDDWSHGYMVFYQSADDKKTLSLLRVEKNSPLTHIRTNTPRLEFTGDGRSLNRATFHIQAHQAFRLVVYDSGRMRLSSP